MDGVITYRNTDLDLESVDDLTLLAKALESGGVSPLRVMKGDDGLWHASFETDAIIDEPDPAIATMLTIVESLAPPLRAAWAACRLREFNIGYDCGEEPWAYNQGLSAGLLGRMAAADASLRITIYPDREDST